MDVKCHFCEGPDAAYLKKVRGAWVDACFYCCTGKPRPAEDPKIEDLTFLDDEPTVTTPTATTAKPITTLFEV